MPRNVTVTFADGSQHVYANTPDDVTPEQVQARAAQEFQKRVTHLDGGGKRSTLDTVVHKAKLVGSDIVKGLGALPALILDANAFHPITGEPVKEFGGASRALQESMTKPETDAEKWQSIITQGAAGGLVGPGAATAPVRSMVAGAAAGAGSEGAARLFGEGVLQRLLGGLAGGVAAGGVTSRMGRMSPNAEELGREALEGLDPVMLKKAQDFMQSSAQQGVSMDVAQALEAVGAPASNITTLRNVLANNKAGDKVQQILRNQPTELQLRATTAVGGMPGEVWGAGQAANNLTETATEVVNQAKRARSAAVRPLYDAAGDLTPEARSELTTIAKSWATKPGATEEVKAAAASFAQKLSGRSAKTEGEIAAARQALAAATSPSQRAAAQARLAAANQTASQGTTVPIRAADVDTWIGEAIGPYKGTPLSPPNPKALGQLKGMTKELNEWFQAASPEVKRAEAEFARITENSINPLKQGPIGQLSTPRGYRPDTQAPVARMNALFEAGVDPQSKTSPIKQAATELAKVDKTAFADAAKTFYSDKLAKVFEPTIGGALSTNGEAADRLWKALFASEKQYQGMKDTVTSVAKTYGLSEQAAARGLENFAQITKALRSRPATVGGLAREEVFRMGGKNYGADALRIFGFLPFERAARKLEDRTMQNAFRDFDNLLTTPEGVSKLIELSKVPVISDKTVSILSTLGGTAPGVGAALNTPGVTAK